VFEGLDHLMDGRRADPEVALEIHPFQPRRRSAHRLILKRNVVVGDGRMVILVAIPVILPVKLFPKIRAASSSCSGVVGGAAGIGFSLRT
jgi:hypothetical protein